MKYIILTAVVLFILVGGIGANTYVQHFNQKTKTTATSGWVFKKTLNLEEYKNVSTGNDLWGTYNNYTRSDRHTETLTVYCNKFCRK